MTKSTVGQTTKLARVLTKHLTPSLGIFFLLALGTTPASHGAEVLLPYDATYKISRSGLTAQRHIRLRRDGELYTLVARLEPTGLLALSGWKTVTEESRFVLKNDRIHPLTYRRDDGSTRIDKDIQINFDWSSGKSHGRAKGQAQELTLVPHLVDPLTFELAARRALLRGEQTPLIQVHEGHQIRPYRLIFEGQKSVPLGETNISTFQYFIDRQSKRRLYCWLMPDHYFLPARCERRHKKKLKTRSILVTSSLL